jgi:hypothetical protein
MSVPSLEPIPFSSAERLGVEMFAALASDA